MQTRKVGIIVLGMHRSGTSVLTRVLNLLGCDLPKTLVSGGPGNELGHWESWPIVMFNDRILDRIGSTWDDWQGIAPRWFDSPAFSGELDAAAALLTEEANGSNLFVVKDPRICRLLPFWQEAIARTEIEPKYLIQFRNPLEVADSLAQRDALERDYSLLLWLRHVLEAEWQTRGQVRTFASFHQLLGNCEAQLARIGRALELEWPRQTALVLQEVRDWIVAGARHHRHSLRELADNHWLSAWVRDVAAILAGWVERGEDAADHAALDAVRGAFEAASPAFGGLILTGRQARAKVAELEQETARLGAIEQQVSEINGELAALRDTAAGADALAARAAELEQALIASEALLGERGGENDALARELDQLRDTQARLAAELVASNARELHESDLAARNWAERCAIAAES